MWRTQRGLSAATKLEDWIDYAIRSDCAPFSLAQFDNLAQKTRLSRLVVQRVQVNAASLRLFLRSSTGPNRALEPQTLGHFRDPVRTAEGPTHDFGFSILDFGLRTEATRVSLPEARARGEGFLVNSVHECIDDLPQLVLGGADGPTHSLVPGKPEWPPMSIGCGNAAMPVCMSKPRRSIKRVAWILRTRPTSSRSKPRTTGG